jgi:hypothetical protein
MIVKIDSVDFEVPKAAGQAVLKLQARADELGDQIKKQSTEIATEKARADKAEEDRDKAIAERNDAAGADSINKAVKARVELVTQATKILGDKDAKGAAWNFDALTDDEIREAVVLKSSPKAAEKIDAFEGEARSTYIAHRFDAAIETAETAPVAPAGNAGLDRFRVQAAMAGGERSDAVETARAKAAKINANRGTMPLGTVLPSRASMVKDD